MEMSRGKFDVFVLFAAISQLIYEYVDLDVPILARRYDQRVKGYRSIGYEIEDDHS